MSNSLLRGRLCSALGVPLLAGDRVLGVVHIGTTTPHAFTADDQALLEQAADRVARAVERARLFAEAEAARQAAERQATLLSTTLQALGDGLAITDAHGRIQYSNPAFSALLGAAPGDAGRNSDRSGGALAGGDSAGLPLRDMRDAQGRPLTAEQFAIARALRGETLTGSEALAVQICRQDGKQAHLSVTGTPVYDAAGAVTGAVIVVRDVTQQRQLEQEAQAAARQAKERAERLEAVFSAVADGLFVYDATGHIVEGNPAADTMLAAFATPGTYGSSIYERGRRVAGGLRDAAGQRLDEAQWPEARIARGEVLSGPSSVNIRMRRADGQDALLNVSGAPLWGDDGAIIGSVCLYRDITSQWELYETIQQSARELEAANTRLHTLVEVLPAGVAIVDANGKALLVNGAVRRIWGQSLPISESTAQYGAYRAWRTDTGQQVAADEWGLVRALRAGTASVGIELDIEAFDGRRKTILDSALPLRDESGAVTGAVSIIFDITEQKLQARRTREALEAFIAITRTLTEAPDEEGETEACSADPRARPGDGQEPQRDSSSLARRLAELTRGVLGCSRVSISAVDEKTMVALPVTVVGLTPEQERQWWAEQRAQPPQAVGEGLVAEDRKRLLAGEVLTLDLTRPPYQIPNAYGVTTMLATAMHTQGRLVGMLALDFQEPGEQPHVFTPEEMHIAAAVARLGAVVLERDRLLRERELARAEALALVEANRRMDEFLGIASHELRTPLTTVKANLQLAERRARQILEPELQAARDERGERRGLERKPIEQLLRLLNIATSSVERQERLVNDLLDVSRIAVGRLERRTQRHDLVALVREAVEQQRVSVPERRITLETPTAPLAVEADADRIGQVLTNYLTNALKYSDVAQPVAVTLEHQGSVARVAVRDRGPGLAPAQQRRLFERFHRVEGIEVVSGSGVGLGLGLYISKTIVEQHGGAVGVESVVGTGSTFWFTLPLVAPDEDAPAAE